MFLLQIADSFFTNFRQTTALEYIAVASGIASVWFSRKENILVYPVGLIGTVIYTWLSFKLELIGEAAVNFYYTIVSLWGWWLWARRDRRQQPVLQITFSNAHAWRQQVLFFALLYAGIFAALTYLKKAFYPGAIPWADAFASATAFTGMWLMAKKKVESWWWWIATDFASVPLYFVKGLVVTSIYYFILLILAVAGLLEWMKKARIYEQESRFESE